MKTIFKYFKFSYHEEPAGVFDEKKEVAFIEKSLAKVSDKGYDVIFFDTSYKGSFGEETILKIWGKKWHKRET